MLGTIINEFLKYEVPLGQTFNVGNTHDKCSYFVVSPSHNGHSLMLIILFD